MRGLLSEGQLWIDRMLSLVSEPGRARTRGLFVGASLATLRGDVATGARMITEAAQIAQRLGDQESLAYVVQGRGLVALYADEIEDSFTLFQESLRFFEAIGDDTGAAFTSFLYGVSAMLRGDSVHVALAHERCRELTEAKGEAWIWSSSLWVTAVDAWRQGEPDRSADLLRTALRLKRPLDDHLGIVECIETLAWVNATNHNRERAATLLGAAERIWRGMGITASTLPGFDRFHSESKRVARAIGERPFQAAYRVGQRMTFGEAIDCALETSIPYRPVADQTDARARLTRRELEIAGLIAQGLSNRDIAEGLVLSPRTVEAHVQHLLAKLGFTSRRQVASWVAEQQTGQEHTQ
jgi:DNA-binding CsgD family transcriptional regulator